MFKALSWLGSIAFAISILAGCNKESATHSPTASQPTTLPANSTPNTASAVQAALPSPPRHNYAMVDNGTYGYEQALSEEDIRKGTATKPLLMMRYVGNRNGAYVVIILGQDANESSIVTRVSCQVPCNFAKSEVVSGDTVLKTETIRVTSESLVGVMLADAAADQLVPYGASQGRVGIAQPATAVSASASEAGEPSNSNESTTDASSSQHTDGPLQRTSFDCNQVGSLPQYLICHDPELAASDVALADLVQLARNAAQNQAAFSDRVRKQWNYREKNCKDKACITAWYSYETDIMNKIAQSGDADIK